MATMMDPVVSVVSPRRYGSSCLEAKRQRQAVKTMVSSANAVPEAIRRELLPSGSAVVPPPAAIAPEPSREARKCLTFLEKNGAGEGIRTLDPNLGKVVLYP